MFLKENYLGEEDVSAKEYKNGDYYLKVSGDSMKDIGIMDGSLVYVKSCQTVNNGDIAVVTFDDELTIKKYFMDNTGITLKACNPEYQDKHFDSNKIKKTRPQILGKVLFIKNYL